MFNYTVMRLFVCLVAVLILGVACAKAPENQVALTRSVLDSAMTSEAEKYAPDELKAAKDSLEVAMIEIEKQNSKFALTRKYGKSEQQLQSAQSLARTAAEAAVVNKARIKSEAEDMMRQLETAITESKALIEQAPRGKEGIAALELIKSDVTAVETSLPEISATLAKEDFIGAREMARAGLEKIQAVNDELNQAIAKKQMIKKSM